MKTLTPREVFILVKHCIERRIFAEIARELGITGERVRQLEARALEKVMVASWSARRRLAGESRPAWIRRMFQYIPLHNTGPDAPRPVL